MCDQPDDAFTIRGDERRAGLGKAFGQPVDPESPVGNQHHLDNGRVFQKSSDVRPERRAQHAGTARERFCLRICVPHVAPRRCAGLRSSAGHWGRIEEAGMGATQQESGCHRSGAKKYRSGAISSGQLLTSKGLSRNERRAQINNELPKFSAASPAGSIMVLL